MRRNCGTQKGLKLDFDVEQIPTYQERGGVLSPQHRSPQNRSSVDTKGNGYGKIDALAKCVFNTFVENEQLESRSLSSTQDTAAIACATGAKANGGAETSSRTVSSQTVEGKSQTMEGKRTSAVSSSGQHMSSSTSGAHTNRSSTLSFDKVESALKQVLEGSGRALSGDLIKSVCRAGIRFTQSIAGGRDSGLNPPGLSFGTFLSIVEEAQRFSLMMSGTNLGPQVGINDISSSLGIYNDAFDSPSSIYNDAFDSPSQLGFRNGSRSNSVGSTAVPSTGTQSAGTGTQSAGSYSRKRGAPSSSKHLLISPGGGSVSSAQLGRNQRSVSGSTTPVGRTVFSPGKLRKERIGGSNSTSAMSSVAASVVASRRNSKAQPGLLNLVNQKVSANAISHSAAADDHQPKSDFKSDTLHQQSKFTADSQSKSAKEEGRLHEEGRLLNSQALPSMQKLRQHKAPPREGSPIASTPGVADDTAAVTTSISLPALTPPRKGTISVPTNVTGPGRENRKSSTTAEVLHQASMELSKLSPDSGVHA